MGRVYVDDPLLFPEAAHHAGESDGVFEVRGGTTESQVPEVVGGTDGCEDERAEQGAHPGGGKEVVVVGLNPARAIESETACRDHAVDMGVVVELSGPGVQDDGEAELCTKHVGGEGGQCPSGCVEEDVVDGLLIA